MVKKGITVFARLKPEKRRKGLMNYKIHRRPKKHSDEDFLVLTVPPRLTEYIDNRPESWNFSFYRIFDHDAPQDDVFECVARPVIDSVFDGYNATIFAYGQTGSGKTYTITGEPDHHVERGILPRTLQYVFDNVRKNPENLYSIEIAYLEIYNENGYDLLLEREQREAATRLEDLPRVIIQEDENGTTHLKNLSFRIVENENEALKLLIDGDSYRAISETPMNPRSSRSHCIFTIVVSVKTFGADYYSSAKMHLVDLAGSERVYKCAIQGTILTEAKHINLSLHFLEQVIVCLSQDHVSHVPYRNSLLTSILRDSLGGNCLTTMLATLSASNFNLEETISTCRFAQRVALVKNDVNLTFELDARSENKLLRMENERLRKQLEALQKTIIPELSSSRSTTGSLEYYKNLVIQRDTEISHLIEIFKKQKIRQESVTKETSRISVDVQRDDKSTQVPSSRLSRKINRSFQESETMNKRYNVVQEKTRISPRISESVGLEKGRMILQVHSSRSQIPKVPTLNLENENLYAEAAQEVSVLRKDRKPSETADNIQEIIHNESQRIETIKSPHDQYERETHGSRVKSHGPNGPSPNDNDKSERNVKLIEKNSSTENSPKLSQNVVKMIQSSCDKQLNAGGHNSLPMLKSDTPKASLKTPNISLNILCNGKDAGSDYSHEQNDKKLTSRKNSITNNIDKNVRKSLPLTGDPEIDEEIIAFYAAKRGGGSY